MALEKIGSVTIQKRPMIKPSHELRNPQTIELQAGHKKTEGCRELPCSMLLEQDAIITMRDGVKLRADIYRPKTDDKVPAIIMWGPYGKSGNGKSECVEYGYMYMHINLRLCMYCTNQVYIGILNLHLFPLRVGIPQSKLSGYEGFEGYKISLFSHVLLYLLTLS